MTRQPTPAHRLTLWKEPQPPPARRNAAVKPSVYRGTCICGWSDQAHGKFEVEYRYNKHIKEN